MYSVILVYFSSAEFSPWKPGDAYSTEDEPLPPYYFYPVLPIHQYSSESKVNFIKMRFSQGSKGIKQLSINFCTSQMMVHKITPTVD